MTGVQTCALPIFDDASERFNSGPANITLESSITMEDGAITSTGGIVYLEKGGSQSGGELDVTSSTLKLGDDYSKSGGTLTSTENGTTLELTDNLTLTSNTVLALLGLTLNDNTLTLGSETSGLTVGGPITLDQADEQIVVNAADLTLKGLLSVDDGGINSDNASLIFTGGINQTGGLLKLNNGQLELAGDISKTGGTLQTSDTETTISADMKITSNSELSVKSIDLGDNSLELGSATSDLVVSGGFSLVEVNVHLITGDADLRVEGNVNLTEGKLESTDRKSTRLNSSHW